MRMGAFECVGDAEKEMILIVGAEELEAAGEAGRSKAARNRESGNAGEIGGAIVAEKQGAAGLIGADERSGDRRSGDNEGVERIFREGEMQLLDKFVTKIECFEIRSGGDFGAEFEAGANVFAIIGRVGGEPAGLLMIVSGFGPGDLVAGGLCFLE